MCVLIVLCLSLLSITKKKKKDKNDILYRLATAKNENVYSLYICPYHKIYRLEAVSLSYTSKIRLLWKCEIWGNFEKISYFVKNFLVKSSNLKVHLHITNCDCLSPSCFVFFNRFSVKCRSSFLISRFKITSSSF